MSVLQSRRYQIKGNYQPAGSYQPLDVDLTAVAASGLAAAWTAYTPTVASSSGTIATVGARSGRYLIIGKLTLVWVSAAITTAGTGSGFVNISLPVAANNNAIFAGRENVLTGKMLQGIAVGTTLSVAYYDGTYPGASGTTLILSGSYETT